MALTRLERYRSIRNEDGREINPALSSYSSMDSLHDPYCSDVPSEDLDKLSTCLSEASSDSNERKETSVFTDILQAQLALWTLFGSIFYTYAWQQHRKKFLFSLFVVVPPVALVCCTISSMLTCIVILGRVFSSPVRFEDMLNYKSTEMTENGIRRRSNSINSLNSLASGRSSSCEELPKPVCRKHSNTYGSYNSLNQISLRSTSPSMYSNGSVNGRCGPSPSHKLSYTFAHCSGGADEVAN
ncbi:unnamed protein product [Bursaphelenchus xylophilus]|uniref:(pine wood nematode) hypothetical protein n=1 Tax=Bursaphelenchus xylophilus TaxID=6326 RepID=A0A1I7RPT3_BURXY|nr:unnamed protein product [Bursaphelenchus xylophilus]CAG9096574.1 unnamed protein product [Bursaphelenchus xylophilus]